MSNIDTQLAQAYELIENNQLDEARNLLQPLTESNPDNADVWWVYAYAVEDRDEALQALENVRRIDPNYAGLDDLTSQMSQQPISSPASTDSTELSDDEILDDFDDVDDFADFGDDQDDDIDELLDNDDDFDDFLENDNFIEADDKELAQQEPAENRRMLVGVLMIVILLIVVVLGALLAFGGADDDADTPETTQVAESTNDVLSQSTEEVIVDAEETSEDPDVGEQALDTDENAPSQTVDNSEGLYTALSGLNVIANSAEVTSTSLGDTTTISICTEAGNRLRDDLTNGMGSLATEADTLSGDALGLKLVNCEDEEDILNIIAVPVEDALSFVNGDITEDEFRAQWRPVG